MKNRYLFNLGSIILITAILCGCVKIKKSDAEYEREEWIAGFADSIEYYKQRAGNIELRLNDLNSKISSQLDDFEKIRNPREVEGYYLLKSWKNKLPLTSTGLYARINENEKFEMLATLSGAGFNQIGIKDGNEILKSEVVPHDQAFNFRHERYTTVYFYGGKVDTIADYIANNSDKKIALEFLEGKVKKNYIIPDNEKQMIAKTWQLYSSQKEAMSLQKELWICSKKIETFRRIMDENEIKDNNQ